MIETPSACSTSDDEANNNIDEIDAHNVHFNIRNYNGIIKNLQCQRYYIICFDNLGYVGKVVDIKKSKVSVEFMVRKPNDKYDWPIKNSIEDIYPAQIICGPLKLSGSIPFTVKGVSTAVKNHLNYLKESHW